jgi:hypothetical protein
MIQVTMTYKCRACGSENIVKHGGNKAGNAQYHGKECGAYRVLVRKAVRQLTKNVGSLRFVSVSLVLFVKRCHSPSRSAIMRVLPVALSFNPISVLHRFGLKASA